MVMGILHTALLLTILTDIIALLGMAVIGVAITTRSAEGRTVNTDFRPSSLSNHQKQGKAQQVSRSERCQVRGGKVNPLPRFPVF